MCGELFLVLDGLGSVISTEMDATSTGDVISTRIFGKRLRIHDSRRIFVQVGENLSDPKYLGGLL